MSAADARAWLRDLTGFSRAVFVQSGSAALELALTCLAPSPATVGVPALGCVSLPAAALDAGHDVQLLDVDPHLAVTRIDRVDGPVVVMDPWGAPADWRAAARHAGPAILDMTLAPGAYVDQTRPSESFDAAVVSFGRGKPVDVGAGGAFLFDDRALEVEAMRHLLFGVERGAWCFKTRRYVFADALFDPLARALAGVRHAAARSRMRLEDVERHLDRLGLPLSVPPLRAGGERGLTRILALALAPDYPLAAASVMATALVEGVPVVSQFVDPFGPPLAGHEADDFPAAADLARRLVFVDATRMLPIHTIKLARVLEELQRRPAAYELPYRLTEDKAPIPEQFAHWQHGGRVCRSLDGTLFVVDELFGRAFRVAEPVAAAVQGAEASVGA